MSLSSADRRAMVAAEAAERQRIIRRTYRARLVSQYGPERADAILAGDDAAFNADVAAWRSLGRPKGLAA